MKKNYEEPVIEIIEFEIEDITCSSIIPGASWVDID